MAQFNMQSFAQPEAEYRIHPFWFWNGEMDDEQIRYQIDEMADKGLGDFSSVRDRDFRSLTYPMPGFKKYA